MSWLLRSRVRKSRRDLWITLYISLASTKHWYLRYYSVMLHGRPHGRATAQKFRSSWKEGKSGYTWELCCHHYFLLVPITDRNEQLCHCHFRQCPEISLMKWQFVVVTQAVPPPEILALLDSWITNTPVKMLCPQTNCSSLYFRRTITCLSVDLLRLGLFFSLSLSLVKLFLGFVATNCCFMSYT